MQANDKWYSNRGQEIDAKLAELAEECRQCRAIEDELLSSPVTSDELANVIVKRSGMRAMMRRQDIQAEMMTLLDQKEAMND